MCIDMYEYAKGPSRFMRVLNLNTGVEDLSYDIGNVEWRVQERGPDPRGDSDSVRQAQEILRGGPEIDRGMPSRYDDREVRYDYDERLFQGQGTMTASSLSNTNFNVFDHMEQRYRDRHGSGDSDWVIRTNHGTR
jgi:hypothetical protein